MSYGIAAKNGRRAFITASISSQAKARRRLTVRDNPIATNTNRTSYLMPAKQQAHYWNIWMIVENFII
jgi:hypothetical protein